MDELGDIGRLLIVVVIVVIVVVVVVVLLLLLLEILVVLEILVAAFLGLPTLSTLLNVLGGGHAQPLVRLCSRALIEPHELQPTRHLLHVNLGLIRRHHKLSPAVVGGDEEREDDRRVHVEQNVPPDQHAQAEVEQRSHVRRAHAQKHDGMPCLAREELEGGHEGIAKGVEIVKRYARQAALFDAYGEVALGGEVVGGARRAAVALEGVAVAQRIRRRAREHREGFPRNTQGGVEWDETHGEGQLERTRQRRALLAADEAVAKVAHAEQREREQAEEEDEE